MDKVTTYKYAFGNIKDLREGDFSSMLSSDDLSDLGGLKKSGRLVLPEFVGVYQQRDFVFHNYDEASHEEEIREGYKEFYDFIQNQSNTLLMTHFGQEDTLNPNLIHLIYDKDTGWTRTLVEECLKDLTGRVVLSDVSNVPDFGRKNTSTCYSMMVQEMRRNRQDMGTYLLEHQPVLKEVLDTASTFGLTREEYAFLQVLRDASKKDDDCRIIDDPMLLGMAENMMDNFPDNPFMHD